MGQFFFFVRFFVQKNFFFRQVFCSKFFFGSSGFLFENSQVFCSKIKKFSSGFLFKTNGSSSFCSKKKILFVRFFVHNFFCSSGFFAQFFFRQVFCSKNFFF